VAIEMTMSEGPQYFYWSRRTFVFPPTPWVAVRPFVSQQKAETSRSRCNARFDMIVGLVFTATSLEAAQCSPVQLAGDHSR